MSMKSFMTDTVMLIKKDGSKIENIKASVQSNKIFINDGTLPIEEGDIITRKLPNDLMEEYLVEDRGYFAAFHGIGAHYQIKVSKNNKPKKSTSTTYNLHGNNSKVNINSNDSSINIANINKETVFQELSTTISNQIIDPTEKQQLLDKIKELESVKNTNNYNSKYTEFLGMVSKYITIISPFIPMLTEYLKK